jgi:hypothetical protein
MKPAHKIRADSVQAMNSTNQREEEVFCAALNVPDPVRRQMFLDQACGGDSSFRAQIESLLAAQSEADRFFDRTALTLEIEASSPLQQAPPARPARVRKPRRSGQSQTTREDSAAS